MLTHDASLWAFVRDELCILGGWFAVKLVYPRLLVTWFVGVSLGVLVRAAIVGRWPGAFYFVALGFTLLFVLAARSLLLRVRR